MRKAVNVNWPGQWNLWLGSVCSKSYQVTSASSYRCNCKKIIIFSAWTTPFKAKAYARLFLWGRAYCWVCSSSISHTQKFWIQNYSLPCPNITLVFLFLLWPSSNFRIYVNKPLAFCRFFEWIHEKLQLKQAGHTCCCSERETPRRCWQWRAVWWRHWGCSARTASTASRGKPSRRYACSSDTPYTMATR